jgi:hypothetical protein
MSSAPAGNINVEADDLCELPTENSDGLEDGFKDQKVIALNETVGNVRNAIVILHLAGLQPIIAISALDEHFSS